MSVAGEPLYSTPDDHSDRTPLRIEGRFIRDNGAEHLCETKSFSLLVLRLQAEDKPALNEHLVLFLKGVGRIEGWVVRVTPTGFAIIMQPDAEQRQKTGARFLRLARLRATKHAETRSKR